MPFTQFHFVEKVFTSIQKIIRMPDVICGAGMTQVGAESAAPLLSLQPHPNTAITRTSHALISPIYVQHKLTTMLGGTRRSAMNNIPRAFFTVGFLHNAARNTVSLRLCSPLRWNCNYKTLFFWRKSPQWTRTSSFLRFIEHTQQRTKLGRKSDRLVAETSTWQHTTLTTGKHPCPW